MDSQISLTVPVIITLGVVIPIILIILTICIKKLGISRISKDGLELSTIETRIHEIQRKQVSYIKLQLDELKSIIEKHQDEVNEHYDVRYVIEVLYDELIEWVMYNNIIDSDNYVDVHRERLLLAYYGAINDECDFYKDKFYVSLIGDIAEKIIRYLYKLKLE